MWIARVQDGVLHNTPFLFLERPMSFVPSIDPAVFALAPGFRALSLMVRRPAGRVADAAVAASALADAVACVQAGQPDWADAHMTAWADVFRSFGAKPQRTPCSAQSLRDRVVKTGGIDAIDPVVDLYNAISLKFAVPVGGESMRAYNGNPRLAVATGAEHFDTMKNGEPAVESPEQGEVVWRDDSGITCRRWNWRQGVRTRIDLQVNDMCWKACRKCQAWRCTRRALHLSPACRPCLARSRPKSSCTSKGERNVCSSRI
jgi:DNA/RNA-binding domain of Phe-tRNA-synthetase-like protein